MVPGALRGARRAAADAQRQGRPQGAARRPTAVAPPAARLRGAAHADRGAPGRASGRELLRPPTRRRRTTTSSTSAATRCSPPGSSRACARRLRRRAAAARALRGPDRWQRLARSRSTARTAAATSRCRAVPATAPSPPLSFAQERLWFLDQLEPESTAYNIAGGAPPRAARSTPRRSRAPRRGGRRATRRCAPRFRVDAGEAACRWSPPAAPVDLPSMDSRPPRARRRRARRCGRRHRERRHALRPRQAALLRRCLVRLATGEHVLAASSSTTSSRDGWSIGVLVRELAALYRRPPRGRRRPAARRCRPVRRLRRLAARALAGRGARRAARLLARAARAAAAPRAADRPAPRRRASPNARPRTRATVLGPSSPRVGGAARARHGRHARSWCSSPPSTPSCPPHRPGRPRGRHARRRPRASERRGPDRLLRQHPGAARRMLGRATFPELLRRGRARRALAAYAHQELPFERLVEELRARARAEPRAALPGASSPSRTRRCRAGARRPLRGSRRAGRPGRCALQARPDAGDREPTPQRRCLEYATDLFDARPSRGWSAHFRPCSDACVARSRGGRSAPSAAHRRATAQLARGVERHRRRSRRASCPRRLFAAAGGDARPARPRGRLAGRRADLRASSTSRRQPAGRSPARAGRGPGRAVGLCLHRGPGLLVALLGVLKAGGAYVPLDPAYPPERLACLLARRRRCAVARHRRRRRRRAWPCPDGRAAWSTSTPRRGAMRVPSAAASTAEPRRTTSRLRHLHLGLDRPAQGGAGRRTARVVNLLALDGSAELRARRRATGCSRSPSLSLRRRRSRSISLPLAGGARRSSWPPRRGAPDGAGLRDARSAATASTALQADARHLAAAARRPAGRGRPACAALSSAARRCRRDPGRGAARRAVGDAVQPLRPDRGDHLVAPLGRVDARRPAVADRPARSPTPGSTCSTAPGQPVPLGVPGRAAASAAPGLARGYLGRPELTAERFVPDPFGGEPGARLYRTGDLGPLPAPTARLEFLGRIDHQVKIRGFRIELGEIEAALADHPGGARGGGGRSRGRRGRPAPGRLRGAAERDAPTAAGAARLPAPSGCPSYMVPARLRRASRPCRSPPNGKVDRRALPAPPEPRDAGAGRRRAAHAGRGAARRPLGRGPAALERVGVRRQLLRARRPLAPRHPARLAHPRSAFGVELPLRALFEAPTVAGAGRAGSRPRRRRDAAPPRRRSRAPGDAAALLRPGAALVPRPAGARQPAPTTCPARAAPGRRARRARARSARFDRDRPPPRGAAHHLPSSDARPAAAR